MTTKNHNKYYEVEIRENTDKQYEVWTHWGRIGNKGRYCLKHAGFTLTNAIYLADRIIKSKQERGYSLPNTKSKKGTTQSTPKKVDKKYTRFIALLEQ